MTSLPTLPALAERPKLLFPHSTMSATPFRFTIDESLSTGMQAMTEGRAKLPFPDGKLWDGTRATFPTFRDLLSHRLAYTCSDVSICKIATAAGDKELLTHFGLLALTDIASSVETRFTARTDPDPNVSLLAQQEQLRDQLLYECLHASILPSKVNSVFTPEERSLLPVHLRYSGVYFLAAALRQFQIHTHHPSELLALKLTISSQQLVAQAKSLQSPKKFKEWLYQELATLNAHGVAPDEFLQLSVLTALQEIHGGSKWQQWLDPKLAPLFTSPDALPPWEPLLDEAVQVEDRLRNSKLWASNITAQSLRFALNALQQQPPPCAPRSARQSPSPSPAAPASAPGTSNAAKKKKNAPRNRPIPEWKLQPPASGQPNTCCKQYTDVRSGKINTVCYEWIADHQRQDGGTGLWTATTITRPDNSTIPAPARPRPSPPRASPTPASGRGGGARTARQPSRPPRRSSPPQTQLASSYVARLAAAFSDQNAADESSEESS
jgi:hypothetical protein